MLSSWSQPAFSASSFLSAFARCLPYDGQIRAAVTRWWPDLPDWLLWRAQLFQESRCAADARSPAGALGIAQFMMPSWRDWARRLDLDPLADPRQAKHAIPAGAAYMASLRGMWGRGRTPPQKHWLAVPSYNAGAGNVLKAQRLCDDVFLWEDIAPCLVKVTGERNSHETLTYVVNIRKWRSMMEAE